MLKTRILTALLLFVFFVSALFAFPHLVWVLVATLVASLGAWEWGSSQRYSSSSRLGFALAVAAFAATIVVVSPEALGLGEPLNLERAWTVGRWFYVPAAGFWLIVVPCWLRGRWMLPAQWRGSLVGLLVILPTWLALIQLRHLGPWVLLAIMAVVWVADTGAYFCGRAFGRRKLAPSISPGKTWEGAIGGACFVVLYGFCALQLGFGYAVLREWPLLAGALLIFAALSVIGDLFESLLKRQAGLKDSSALLPGHGGVLDRIDSLTSTLPLVAMAWLLTAS